MSFSAFVLLSTISASLTFMPVEGSMTNPKQVIAEHTSVELIQEATVKEQSEIPVEEPKKEEPEKEEVEVVEETTYIYEEDEEEAFPAPKTAKVGDKGLPTFTKDGLLEMARSRNADIVVELLLSIPGHSNGASYHAKHHIDEYIDTLSTPEAIYVLRTIEGAGFGQVMSGYAGIDTPESHKSLIRNQLNLRYGGSIHELLKEWGTYSYSGY